MADRIHLHWRVRFPCSVCDRACGIDTIEHSACSSWVHHQCVTMTSDQMPRFSTTDILYVQSGSHRRPVWLGRTSGVVFWSPYMGRCGRCDVFLGHKTDRQSVRNVTCRSVHSQLLIGSFSHYLSFSQL